MISLAIEIDPATAAATAVAAPVTSRAPHGPGAGEPRRSAISPSLKENSARVADGVEADHHDRGNGQGWLPR